LILTACTVAITAVAVKLAVSFDVIFVNVLLDGVKVKPLSDGVTV